MIAMRHLVLAAVLATAVVTQEAKATEYIYTYTGNPFTNVNPPWTTSDAIHFQITQNMPLGDGLNDAGDTAVTSWSLSVGPLHYSGPMPGGCTSTHYRNCLYSINFSTDSTGNITAYQFTTLTDVVAPHLLPANYPPQIFEEEVGSYDIQPFGEEDLIGIPSIFMDSEYTYNDNNPGVWALAVVAAEPPTLTLMLVGFAGLGFAFGRKKHNFAAAWSRRLDTPFPSLG
jgi:hypothetical protein